LGETKPFELTTRNMQASTPGSPSQCVAMSTSSPTLPVARLIAPKLNSRIGPSRPTSRPLTWLATMSPAPFNPNARLNMAGLSPNVFSSANGAPAT
jgi:hypothetical protein